jgi:hypothetical protein
MNVYADDAVGRSIDSEGPQKNQQKQIKESTVGSVSPAPFSDLVRDLQNPVDGGLPRLGRVIPGNPTSTARLLGTVCCTAALVEWAA